MLNSLKYLVIFIIKDPSKASITFIRNFRYIYHLLSNITTALLFSEAYSMEISLNLKKYSHSFDYIVLKGFYVRPFRSR